MTQSNGTTVQVGLGTVQSKNLLNRQVLGSKGLVDLDQVHILQVQASLLEGALNGGDGADTHDAGLDGGDVPRDDLGQGLQSVLLDGVLRGNNDGTSSVANARGVTGSDGAILLEDRRELVELLDGGLGASVLIVAQGLDSLLDLVLDGDNLGVEATGLVGYIEVRVEKKTD